MCLGIHFARMELRVALEVDRRDAAEPAARPRRHRHPHRWACRRVRRSPCRACGTHRRPPRPTSRAWRTSMSDDLVIRGARISDGTGLPAFTGDVEVRDGRIASVGRVHDTAGATVDRRRRARPHPRLRRRAHPLRRAALLRAVGVAVVVARRHHRAHRQLRLHPRPVEARRRRLAHADAGQGRGHVGRRAARRRRVHRRHARRRTSTCSTAASA